MPVSSIRCRSGGRWRSRPDTEADREGAAVLGRLRQFEVMFIGAAPVGGRVGGRVSCRPPATELAGGEYCSVCGVRRQRCRRLRLRVHSFGFAVLMKYIVRVRGAERVVQRSATWCGCSCRIVGVERRDRRRRGIAGRLCRTSTSVVAGGGESLVASCRSPMRPALKPPAALGGTPAGAGPRD